MNALNMRLSEKDSPRQNTAGLEGESVCTFNVSGEVVQEEEAGGKYRTIDRKCQKQRA